MRPFSVFLSLALAAGCTSSPGSAAERAALAPAEPESAEAPAHPVWSFLRAKYDADADGRIVATEYPRGERAFANLDADRDGAVTPADFADEWNGRARVERFTYGEGAPEVGEAAPEFELETTGGEPLALASFRGRKPVALVFGSFT